MKTLLLSLVALFTACLPAASQRYLSIHRRAILADTHNDVLSTVTMKGMNVDDDLTGKTHTDLARLRTGGVDIQVFSIFCNEKFGKDTAFVFANIEIDSLYAIVARHPSTLMMVRNPAELQQSLATKKIACMIGVEGGHMIENHIGYLDSLFRRGARYMTLTWNNSTEWASSAADESSNKLPFGQKGLTDSGKQIVRHMNDLGMMVDLSHVGEQTFWDAIGIVTKPVIVSHSCAWSLCPVPRNLKDDQIRAIGKNGGVIHVNFYSGFLDSNFATKKKAFLSAHQAEKDSLDALKWAGYETEEFLAKKYPAEAENLRAPLSLLIDHIDHMVQLIGVDHVGLGSDFDGIEAPPLGLNGVQDFPLVTKALLDRGYSTSDVRKILGENFIRVFKANMQP